ATRSPAQRKMDSRLIYATKMKRGEQIAAGVQTLAVEIPLNEQGEAIIGITARVNAALLSRLEGAGATILSSFPKYNSIRVEVSLDAVEFIAGLAEVIYVQPGQEAIVWQDGGSSDFDPEHLWTTDPRLGERGRNISEKLAKALGDFQLDAYNVGVS